MISQQASEEGQQVGRYRLVRRLAEGGQGIVYVAEQSEPVRRQVALKTIIPGLNTREVIARFDAERQALALMDHPNIAKVLDAGSTDAGQPYFVMDLIDGVPLNDFCDAHRLPIHARLRLFEQVCSAVQHAHTKGVIHRDLKPSNVLVSNESAHPSVRVIDFGVAKAVGIRLTDLTLKTSAHEMLGTPAYMSPEHVSSQGVDTRSDVFSLGVMLYELLSGTTPIQHDMSLAEFERQIAEVDPPWPSQRLKSGDMATLAEKRGTDGARLLRSLRGELDWIVMRALAKDPKRRYQSPEALSSDLRRWLEGAPVFAAPPSLRYVLRKFARKHRWPIASAFALLFTMLIGTAAFAWQARIATARAESLQKVVDFQSTILSSVDPEVAGSALTEYVLKSASDHANADEARSFEATWKRLGPTDAAIRVVESAILAPATQNLNQKFASEPLLLSTLKVALSDQYLHFSLHEQGLRLLNEALVLSRDETGNTSIETLTILVRLGVMHHVMGNYDQAESYLRDALHQMIQSNGPDARESIVTAMKLAMTLRDQGEMEEALDLAGKAVSRSRHVLGDRHQDTLLSINDLAGIYYRIGQLDEAEQLFQEALKARRETGSTTDIDYATLINNIASIRHSRGDFQGAEQLFRENLGLLRRMRGEQHVETLWAINNLGSSVYALGQTEEALELLQQALAGRRAVYQGDHVEIAMSLNALANAYRAVGDRRRAEQLGRQSFEMFQRVAGEAHPYTIQTRVNLAVTLRHDGQLDDAETLLRASVDRGATNLGTSHERQVGNSCQLVEVLIANGKISDARSLQSSNHASIESLAQGDARALCFLVEGHLANHVGSPVLAVAHYRNAWLDVADRPQPDSWLKIQILQGLLRASRSAKSSDSAEVTKWKSELLRLSKS